MKKKWLIRILFILVILAWMYANHKEVENGYFPSTQHADKEQTIDLCSYHSDKGFTIEKNGFIIIKK